VLLTKTNDKESKRTITEIKRTIRKLDYLKTKASRESKLSRSADARRKIQMGGLIITAGLDHLFDGNERVNGESIATAPLTQPTLPSPNLLLGLLLEAKEKLARDPEVAKAWEKRAEGFW